MGYPTLDRYAELDSPIHRLDPRVKWVAALALVVTIVTLRSWSSLLTAIVGVVLIAWVSRLPVTHILRRLLLILPFAGVAWLLLPFIEPGQMVLRVSVRGLFSLAITYQGLEHAAILSLRAAGAVMVLTILTSTTKFQALVRALRDLKVPSLMVSLLEFTVRYIFVLARELQRMQRARKARGFVPQSIFCPHTFRTLGQTIGLLLLRSLDRAERVHQAMLARSLAGSKATMPRSELAPRPGMSASSVRTAAPLAAWQLLSRQDLLCILVVTGLIFLLVGWDRGGLML